MKKMTLYLDELDYEAIQRAITERQKWRYNDKEGGCIMPPGESDTAGATIAEICRGWMELLEARS